MFDCPISREELYALHIPLTTLGRRVRLISGEADNAIYTRREVFSVVDLAQMDFERPSGPDLNGYEAVCRGEIKVVSNQMKLKYSLVQLSFSVVFTPEKDRRAKRLEHLSTLRDRIEHQHFIRSVAAKCGEDDKRKLRNRRNRANKILREIVEHEGGRKYDLKRVQRTVGDFEFLEPYRRAVKNFDAAILESQSE